MLDMCPLNGCVLLYLIISGLLVRLILLLVTSILTNQEAVLRRFVATIYEYFMQQEGLFLPGGTSQDGKRQKLLLAL